MNTDILSIASKLGPKNATIAEPFGSGHINDTYKITCKNSTNSSDNYFILQKINTAVFTQPDDMMDNIKRVTEHLHNKGKKTYKVINYLCPWRLISFIPHSYSVDVMNNPYQAYVVGQAFGQFQNDISDIPAPRLNETIINFHNTVDRLRQLDEAIATDKHNRVKNVYPELDFVDKYRDMAPIILNLMKDNKIPERVTHNDTKINNIMLDSNTNKAIAVVDLDTVMPGCALYDFGDMVRTATASAPEDEQDLTKVYSRKQYFEQLVKGYLSVAKFLNKYEVSNLVFSGILITYTIGIRFLTDYLSGDMYFKTDYEQHNLIRCRTQFKMIQSIEDQKLEYEEIVRRYSE